MIERPDIDLATARRLIDAAVAAAAAIGLEVSVAVVDRGGNDVAAVRMDGAPLGASVLARDKAYTAVLWGAPTGGFMRSTQPGGEDWGFQSTSGGRVVVYAGGLPILAGDAVAGGLGVSGGTGEQDEQCARRALQAVGLER